ncbi:MAG: hypothetical protein AAF483_03170 [Planctomycetota bacterium]
MPEYLHDFPAFGPLTAWYQELKSEGRIDQFLSNAKSEVVEWKHAEFAWYPEIPFAEELYGRKWSKETSDTIPHGLDSQGRLVFLEQLLITAYCHHPNLIQCVKVLRSPRGNWDLQAATHILVNEDGKPLHVANIMDYRSSLNTFEYEDGRLARLISTNFEHPNIGHTDSTELPIQESDRLTKEFVYNSDGHVESGPEAYWSY